MARREQHDQDVQPYWFVVADESRAIIYRARAKFASLGQYRALENDIARKKIDRLIADRGGRSFDSHGEGRHTLQKEKTGPKNQASSGFAKEIVRQLANAVQRQECRHFALIAAPKFLGRLRDEIQLSGIDDPFLTIDKNVVARPAEEIKALIAKYLP